MKEEPKLKFNLSYLSNVQNDFKLKTEIQKTSSFILNMKLTERCFNNLLYNKSFSNSIISSLILTQNNITSNDINNKNLNIKDNINEENSIIKSNEIQKRKNDLITLNNKNYQNNNKILNLKKLVYYK